MQPMVETACHPVRISRIGGEYHARIILDMEILFMTEYDVKILEKKYIEFINIEKMPVYSIESKKVSLSKAESEGFDSIAQTLYKADTQEHILIIADNVSIEPYILFHEFTHILDAEVYAKGDKVKYVTSSGYTEYHASQIELLIMLGAENLRDPISFSIDQHITTIAGEKTVRQYVGMKRRQAMGLYQRKDFPYSIDQLKTAFGLLFNYWGLRSICYMYCKDFEEETDNKVLTRFIPVDILSLMNQLMVGWLTEEKIDLCCKGYEAMVIPLIKKYKLI